MTQSFVILQDLQPNTSSVKIHLKSCYYYRYHKPTTTTTWYDANDYEHAKILAKQLSKDCKKGWRNAKCCIEKVINDV
tara:strand:+ start:607 stop:840 length:234 start_codon:yes stop_codon:yes gene_type:complete